MTNIEHATDCDSTRDSRRTAVRGSAAGRSARRRSSVIAIAIALLTCTGIVAAPGAGASVAPATYNISSWGCQHLITGTMDFSRPVAVAHYTGTTYLYWQAELQQVVNGQWIKVIDLDGAYAHIWSYSGQLLTPIYWGDTANNYGVLVNTFSPGTYRVIGMTYWWNGTSWFYTSSQALETCTF
jgi:hypothetical protein